MKKYVRYIKKNKWQFLFYIVLFFGVVQILFYGFFYFKKKYLISKLDDLNVSIKKEEIKISKLKQDENIKKYLLLLKLNKVLQPTIWSDVMEQMLNIYKNFIAV